MVYQGRGNGGGGGVGWRGGMGNESLGPPFCSHSS